MEVFKLHQEYAHSRKKKDFSFCALVSSEWVAAVGRDSITDTKLEFRLKREKEETFLLLITLPKKKEDKIPEQDSAVNWCLETMT